MREIKFRGRTSQGKWLYGDLVRSEDKVLCDVTACIFPPQAYDSYDRYIVDVNTVGQYTGLKDKNDKEIYEGDVVVLRRRTKNLGDIQTIEWCSHAAAFTRVTDGDDAHFIPAADMALYEVVGNIHDNPELLNNKG